MKIYLVGGAVRDQLLGLPVKEKDWVVVGATVDEMLKKGYRQVGKDFPVFLHPETNEEYALARTERKVGRGYTGFDFTASPQVALEEDLQRRDLTINAIAQTPTGELIDPYHGKQDLEKKILRHVSPAFVEDPVRILRAARFAARFAGLGFQLAPETKQLMIEMVQSGEVDALVAERVWKEWERVLQGEHPEVSFNVLSECGALSVLLPEITIHDTGIAALQCVQDPEIRFAVLVHALSAFQIENLCKRYRVPSAYRELALLLAKNYESYLAVTTQKPTSAQLLDLLYATDAFRRKARFQQFLDAAYAIAGVTSKSSDAELLLESWQATTAVSVQELLVEGLVGKEIADRIYQKRLDAIADLINKERPHSIEK